MYRQKARKDYLNLAKCKKRTRRKIRNAVKKQLQYVRRDLSYIDLYMEQEDVEFTEKQLQRIKVIRELYEQQKYMYDNKVHSVKNRIVSISQPYIRPIVRGKAKSPVEFGAKLDMSMDEKGIARLEHLCFDAYNECDVLTGVIAGLLAQGCEPWDAAALGVYLHGVAGDRIRERNGSHGMLARELADEVGKAAVRRDI